MATPDPNAPGSTASNYGALILVVERKPVVQRLERYFLEQSGFNVELAVDGLAALTRARELWPRILVAEILVPKLDGFSLCRAIKSSPETKDVLVMIFSHLQAEDRATEADEVTSELFKRVREGKIKRVVIDALGDLERSSIDRQRFSDFIYA